MTDTIDGDGGWRDWDIYNRALADDLDEKEKNAAADAKFRADIADRTRSERDQTTAIRGEPDVAGAGD